MYARKSYFKFKNGIFQAFHLKDLLAVSRLLHRINSGTSHSPMRISESVFAQNL